jgi:hypothetical protein
LLFVCQTDWCQMEVPFANTAAAVLLLKLLKRR